MALNGRVALITGASRGLGKAMALALGGAGARLALVSRDAAQLAAVAQEARQLGAQAEVFRADVSDEAQILQLKGSFCPERSVVAFGVMTSLMGSSGAEMLERDPSAHPRTSAAPAHTRAMRERLTESKHARCTQ